MINLESEHAALVEIHAQDRAAHFQTSVEMLTEHQADNFVYVGNGEISHITRADFIATFSRSFKNATYFEWDDLEPPLVRVSDDATMGWMIVRNRVRRTQVQEDGSEVERMFIYAGIMTYEKQNGKWMRVANVSTFAEYKA